MSNSDSELEENEEEILVYVEFDNCATNDVFSNENLKLDMLGLDSDHPVMQVNGKFFQGAYEDAVGTYMFFEKDDNPAIDDPVFDKIPTLKYFQKTRKLLRMQRAFVTSRYEVVGDSENKKCIPNIETIKEAGVPPKYQEKALEFWNESRNNRMNALNEYLKKQEFRKELRARGFEPESESDDDNPFAMYKYIEEAEMSKDAKNDDNSGNFNLQIESLENTLQKTEINKKNEQNKKTLNVIDPGPSTSKDSTLWIDDDITREQKKSRLLHKVKNVERIREKPVKDKVQKRAVKKRKISVLSASEKLFIDSSKTQFPESNDPLENNPLKDTNGQLLDTNVNFKHDAKDETDIDEMIVEKNDKLLAEEFNIEIPSVSEKEKRKQEKREAKMKEIKEKLKAFSVTCNQPPNS
ncbi:uncharacterized protein LOC131664564 [Phymastichus coffea]|uniref:uncharacterized protein LOC131664564 n=1 Tax=Phymastichus coffea TaxID=108790 RepID=UPI00273B3ABA|nr:uncharacterized protein LOC131664564 [Phymastichus coffea]